jgi:hypothetical protein
MIHNSSLFGRHNQNCPLPRRRTSHWIRLSMWSNASNVINCDIVCIDFIIKVFQTKKNEKFHRYQNRTENFCCICMMTSKHSIVNISDINHQLWLIENVLMKKTIRIFLYLYMIKLSFSTFFSNQNMVGLWN